MTNTKNMTVKTVQVGKQVASFLVPDYNEGQKLAIVDEGVLKYLRALLPKSSAYDIIQKFIDNLNVAKVDQSLDDAVNEAKDFVAFQKSINLLREYFDPKVKVEMEAPFNVVRELTITEKSMKLNDLMEEVRKLQAEIDEYNEAEKKREAMPIFKSPTKEFFGDPNDAHEQSIENLGN